MATNSKISVPILFRSSASDVHGTKYMTFIEDDKTLADLRKVLTADEIMTDKDIFFSKGAAIGKGGEGVNKWADIFKGNQVVIMPARKNGEPSEKIENVKVPTHLKAPDSYNPPSVDTKLPSGVLEEVKDARGRLIASGDVDFKDHRGVHELTEDEKLLLARNAGLGEGISGTSNHGPSKTGQIVLDMANTDLQFINAQLGKVEIIVSTSVRASAYAKSGWAEVAISAESPWVSGSTKASTQNSNSESSSSSTYFVTGRYCYPMCQISTPYKVKPHPLFKQAVDEALLLPPDLRTAELASVFDRFGHFYATSIEMGGMKHVTTQKEVNAGESAKSLEAQMQLSIGAKYGVVSGELGVTGGVKNSNKSEFQTSLEKMVWETTGGNIVTDNIDKWKASLSSHRQWQPTRTVSVAPTYKIFDIETQKKISEAIPTTKVIDLPKVALRCRVRGDGIWHYTVTKDFPDINTDWKEHGVVAQLLSSQINGSVPLYSCFINGIFHYLKTIKEENPYGVIIGYIYNDIQPDTVPFWHFTKSADSKTLKRCYYSCARYPGNGWGEGKLVGFVYKAE